jgi:hypothetical protein
LTRGAAVKLTDSIDAYYSTGTWTFEKTERAVMELCKKKNTYGHRLKLEDLKADPYCKQIPNLSEDTVNQVIQSISAKISKGLEQEKNEVLLHTGPHHDDISLGILPHITNQLHDPSNEAHFSVLTSGFTAVTNKFVIDTLLHTKKLLEDGKIQMTNYEDFFDVGYRLKTDKDENDQTWATKLDFMLSSGNNASLFDNAAGLPRSVESGRLALTLLAFQCFAPGGRIGVAKWNGADTPSKGSANHAPCTPSSMLHSYMQGNTLLETVHLNLFNQ